ncbi:immunoglobulin domain-containing protein [uncultured Aquimarina sp.]|uniref:immunoglobulin domain-containing protein n=1 Tax=uncultured Aquimarina sp. TaxID=575652 RepID=UPI00260359B0|nr:immunoglobulin domain-containing protein [uncultured Aquimarina sp.]
MKKLLLYLFLLLSITVFSQEISENDRNALVALYNATDGANWTNTWDLNDSPTNWYGVVTNIVFGSSGAERHVDEINLSDNNLTGIIPQELGNLKDLNTLDLSNNNISGSIPGELGNAEDLNYLYLQNNNLNGDIPPELFSLNDRHFLEVNLSYNQLTGKLPNEARRSFANEGDLLVSNNLLTDLPDYTSSDLFLIKTLDISNNNIYFSIFERIASLDPLVEVLESNVANLTYAPQNKIDQIEEVFVSEGNPIQLSTTELAGSNNTYQWYKNNTLLDGETNSTFQIAAADIIDTGTYYCEIKNATVPDLTVIRNDISLNITDVTVNDRNSLIALYNATDGANWTNPWDLTKNESTWGGVAVNSEGRVIELFLSLRNLNGTLPAEIGNLTELKELTIFGSSSDNLTGSIPESICNLSKLETISISLNKLSGEIPSCLFSISTLKSINISGDSPFFTLDLPNDLSNLVNLETLNLQRVDLSSEGGFPESILQLANIAKLSLSRNQLTGTIPPEISNLSKLTDLSISNNNMTGSIPSEIGLLNDLSSLRISNTLINGSIPIELGNLTELVSLVIANTNVDGEIPSELGNLNKLITLSISGTNITGEIPSTFSNLTQLRTLSLGRNNLNGSIPDFLTTFNNLNQIEFHNNNFSGDIPDFTINSGLTRLLFDNNNFVFDDFENEFSQYENNISIFSHSPQSNIDNEEITTINAGEQHILSVESTQSPNNLYQWRKDGVEIEGATERTYTIVNPKFSDIGEYDCIITNSIVTDLILVRNKIILDVIPVINDNDRTVLISIYNSTDGANWNNPWDITKNENTWEGLVMNDDGRVTELNLSSRNLNGILPNEIGNLTELRKLTIFESPSNNLTGIIPESLCNLTKLDFISIVQTNLTGEIPSCLFSISTLKTIIFHGFRSSFNLDFPDDLSSLAGLETLNLHQVNLSSEIDFLRNITQLSNLTNLSLYTNELNEEIPIEIGNLNKLEYLDIENNNITGNIPNEIGLLTDLIHLTISNTSMNGIIPEEIGNLTNLEILRIEKTDIEGEIPDSFSNLTQLIGLTLQRNNLSGRIPDFLTTFDELRNINIGYNNFQGTIPNFTGNQALRSLYFDNNSFVFEDFENEFATYNANVSYFLFSPQSNIDQEETIIFNEGEEITLSVEATQSSNNLYQWRKDGVEITGAMERTYTISNSTTSDIGEYDCIITNSIVNDLTLFRNKITLDVTLGTEDFDTAGIKAYPVPTKDQLVLSLGAINGEHITASLYGMLGNKVFEQKNLTDNQILDFSNLQSGTYILKLQTNTKTYVSRIIKQ